MKNAKSRIITGISLLAASVFLLLLANHVDGFAQWYSVTIYDVLVNSVGRIFGIFPFSAVEVLIYITILAVVITCVRLIWMWVKKKMDKKVIIHFVAGVFVFASALFFTYVVNCGVNYHRVSFSESAGIGIETYTVDDLANVCQILTEDVNRYAVLVSRDDQELMQLSENVQLEAVSVMESLSEQYSKLEGYYSMPKGLLIPEILSVQHISGIYSPFTIEANYNSGMVDYNIPFTMCHELSHLRGFMQEEEANFIAYLACIESEDVEFQYSGSMLGWIYCTNALYKIDKERYSDIRAGLDDLAEKDLQANSEYWDAYDGQIAEVADKVNDNYLKANGQSEGVNSYNKMVDLIVAYYKQ